MTLLSLSDRRHWILLFESCSVMPHSFLMRLISVNCKPNTRTKTFNIFSISLWNLQNMYLSIKLHLIFRTCVLTRYCQDWGNQAKRKKVTEKTRLESFFQVISARVVMHLNNILSGKIKVRDIVTLWLPLHFFRIIVDTKSKANMESWPMKSLMRKDFKITISKFSSEWKANVDIKALMCL